MNNKKGRLWGLVLWLAVIICLIYIIRLTAPFIYERTAGRLILSIQCEICGFIEKLFGAAIPEISYIFRKTND